MKQQQASRHSTDRESRLHVQVLGLHALHAGMLIRQLALSSGSHLTLLLHLSFELHQGLSHSLVVSCQSLCKHAHTVS